MSEVLKALRNKYDELRANRKKFIDDITVRVLSDPNAVMTEDERSQITVMMSGIDESKQDYEAQRDLEDMLEREEPLSVVEADVGRVVDSTDTDSLRKAARDAGGMDALKAYDERNANVLADFAEMSSSGNRDLKLRVNPALAINIANLRKLGVSIGDYARALRDGNLMIASRAKESGRPDVRVYAVGEAGFGAELVPTFWDNSLYLFASYIGGVMAAGAEIIPVMGNNTLKLPKVTAYAPGINITPEATSLINETKDTTATVDLTPRPYRGFSAETDEIMRAAAIDVRMLLVLRGLARALTLGKENDFHNGTGTNEPKGILDGVAAGRIVKTGGNNTTIRYQDIPAALGKLDAEYHADTRVGSLSSLMHSAIWFNAFVGATGTDGHPLYPHLAMGGNEIFSTRRVFSHAMKKAAADGNILAVTGNFMDAYVIVTMGGQEIQVTDDLRFLSFERVYRIQEYCDGTMRDDKGLAYVASDT